MIESLLLACFTVIVILAIYLTQYFTTIGEKRILDIVSVKDSVDILVGIFLILFCALSLKGILELNIRKPTTNQESTCENLSKNDVRDTLITLLNRPKIEEKPLNTVTRSMDTVIKILKKCDQNEKHLELEKGWNFTNLPVDYATRSKSFDSLYLITMKTLTLLSKDPTISTNESKSEELENGYPKRFIAACNKINIAKRQIINSEVLHTYADKAKVMQAQQIVFDSNLIKRYSNIVDH